MSLSRISIMSGSSFRKLSILRRRSSPCPSLESPRKSCVSLIVLLEIEQHPDLRHVVKKFQHGIVAVLLPDGFFDLSPFFRDAGEHRDQQAFLEIFVEKGRIGKMAAPAMGALDHVELPLQQRLLCLRGLGNVHPGNDRGLEFLVATAALERFSAVRLSLIKR